ncbi:MAG: hypothetical protein OSB25_08380 [Salibacteraceae bacterium]|nr:hypothetical protein [Salibacteraceae bacterium]|tara:strand:- start:12173 stop:12517 length:345 start_codon:yes stop_codon:yes gene_type:complete
MIKQDRIELIKEMLSTNSKDPFLNYAAALEYSKFGDKEKAISLLEDVADFDPKYLGTYYLLGQIYEEVDQLEKAISIYRRGRKIANEQNNNKTLGELNEALMLIDEEFDEAWED